MVVVGVAAYAYRVRAAIAASDVLAAVLLAGEALAIEALGCALGWFYYYTCSRVVLYYTCSTLLAVLGTVGTVFSMVPPVRHFSA